MDVRLIYNHIEHHAAHSGYDQLAKYVTGKPWRKGLLFRLAKQAPKRWREKVPSDKTNWYWGDAIPREYAMTDAQAERIWARVDWAAEIARGAARAPVRDD